MGENNERFYAQTVEVALDDFGSISEVLMRNGYEIKCNLDEVSNIVIIDFIHPEHTGNYFVEVGAEHDN